MDTYTPPRNRSRKLGIGGLALLACIAVALCGLAFSPRAALAAVGDYGTLEDGTYVISSYYASTQGYSRSWDVYDNGKSDGTKVQSWSTDSDGNQRWRITTDSDGYSTIVNAQSGKALDVPGGTFNDLEQLQIYTSNEGKAQKWKIVEQANGYKVLWAGDERYAIDLAYWSTDNGAMLILGGDSGNPNQRWTFKKCTEDTLNISDKQTELFDTSLYITDKQTSWPTVESQSSGWDTCKYSSYSDKARMVYYSGGNYWNSYGAVIKVRYDNIGKVNGKWVSARLTFSSLRGDGYPSWNDGTWYRPDGSQGSGIVLYDYWSGFLYFGLYQLDCTMELFYTSSGTNLSMSGSFVGFGSLNYDSNVTNYEGVSYVSSNNFKSYVLTSTNLVCDSNGTWRGSKADSNWQDKVGTANYNKYSVSFGVVDAKPKFRLSVSGSQRTNVSWVTINNSPLTIATPPSPTKSATITG